jgi:hypothetical protein
LAPHIIDEYQVPPCRNKTICGREFIATPHQMLNTHPSSAIYYKHTTSHKWNTNLGITNTIRLFEMLYEAKFSDIADNKHVRFTGYNKSIGIAFIHGKDVDLNFKDKSEKTLLYIKKYCINRGILLLLFPSAAESITEIIKMFVHMMNGPHIQTPPWINLLPKSDVQGNVNEHLSEGRIAGIILHKFRNNNRQGTLYGEYARLVN